MSHQGNKKMNASEHTDSPSRNLMTRTVYSPSVWAQWDIGRLLLNRLTPLIRQTTFSSHVGLFLALNNLEACPDP